MTPSGTGRGVITADGCAVELYRQLPSMGEAEIVHAAIPAGAPVLDLGCGTGRIAHRLIDLGRTFDAVLLASHLVNLDAAVRHELLSVAARHLSAAGRLVAEWHPPEWFDSVTEGGEGAVGDVRVGLSGLHRDGDRLDATVTYRHGADVWTQTFSARRISEAELERDLDAAGLVLDRWCTDDRTWFAATPSAG